MGRMSSHIPRAIVALDVPTLAEARAIVDRLGGDCDFYKVGLELFTAEGPEAVRWLRASGKEVFLDLKLHDIPNTVRNGAARAADLGASLVTVHGIGGPAMLSAAVAAAGKSCGVLAVTVLTALDDVALSTALGHHAIVVNEVMRLADLAALAGCHGVVCGGGESLRVRSRHGSLRTLVPGVRLRGDAAGDQARVVTPEGAVRAGASYVILGRTVTASSDPVAALRAARLEMEAAGARPAMD